MTVSNDNLIWIDLEMTGLDPEHAVIIEIATIVTDKDLNLLQEGPVFAIHQSDEILAQMDDWCTRTHGNSGLTERVRQSEVSMQEAEQQTIDFLENYVGQGKSPMCGNTVSQDRRFMFTQMPTLEAYFNYRHIDVSTLKELARRWRKDLLSGFVKTGTHLALDDIRESIEELKFYRTHFIKLSP